MLQYQSQTHTSTTDNNQIFNLFNNYKPHNISISNLECLKNQAKSSEYQDTLSNSEDSASTKDSEEHHDLSTTKKSNISQKKSYKKAPQGKMDNIDEELLLSLASKYKHDWKKVSKKIFKLNKKKLGPNLLRIRYKELAPDLTQKRVRFTHKEDLMIVKYYSQYGYDWEKIASQFESRTAIMVKNRFYHIKKKNILEKLLEEVETLEGSSINVDNLAEEEQEPREEIQEEEVAIQEERQDIESVQFFIQKGEEIFAKTLKVSPMEMYVESSGFDQLCEKITPMDNYFDQKDYRERKFEEDNIFSLTYFLGGHRRIFY